MQPTACARRQRFGATLGLGALVASVARPAWSQALGLKLPELTEGPYYPPKPWRAQQRDWDADLTQVLNGGQVRVALGEHLGLQLQVTDTQGKPVDRVEFEIWQCDVKAIYRHPSEPNDERIDRGFQGFGSALTNASGGVSFRTIKPVAYPGRTPHIHIKLRHASFGELTSQLFVSGDPGNAGDGIWRRLGAPRQRALDMHLLPASADGLRWQAMHTVVVAV